MRINRKPLSPEAEAERRRKIGEAQKKRWADKRVGPPEIDRLLARVAELEKALRFCWDQGIHPMCVPTVQSLLSL